MRTNHWLSILLVGLMLAMMLTAVSAAGERASGPPRYQGSINSEQDLLATLAAGLVGDALGYDANEVLDAIEETNMPIEDVLPTFMTAYLSGRTYVNVLERRTEGDRWGGILNRFKVDEGDLEELSIPRDVEVTDLRSMPDQVIEDLLMCAALSEVFDLDPDEVYEYYQEGWTATDVLAAAELAYRSRQTLSELLRGKGIRVDWYREARSLEADLRGIAQGNGRCFDNETPAISEEPRRGDLEVTYSADVAVRTYSIPVTTFQQLRFRYLLSPSEVLQVLYISRSCGRDYWDVARLYSWDHWHAWAPTLVALRLPITHFRSLSIWDELPMDYYAIDPWRLDSILLGCSLSLGGAFKFDFYWSTFDPWYRPWDPILYCGMHWRHGWGWSDYYNWRRAPQPWRGHSEIGRDWGDWQRSRDWAGHRVVGVVVGDHRQPDHPRQSWDRPPRTWDRAYGGDGSPQIVNRDGRVEYGQYPGMTLHKGGRGDRPTTPGKDGIEFGERVGHGGPPPGGGPQGKPGTGSRDDRPTIGNSRPGGPRVEYGEPRTGSGPKAGPNDRPRSGSGDAPVYRPGGPQGNGPQPGQPNISGRQGQPRGNDGGHTPRVVGPRPEELRNQPQPQGPSAGPGPQNQPPHNPQPQGPSAGPGQQNQQRERHQERRGNGGGSVGPGPSGGGGNGGGGGPQSDRPQRDDEQRAPRVEGGGGGNGGGSPQGGGGGGPRGGGGGGGRQGGGGTRHGDVSGR